MKKPTIVHYEQAPSSHLALVSLTAQSITPILKGKKMKRLSFCLLFLVVLTTSILANGPDSLWNPNEKHLQNIQQLTFGGTNAEAYFSFDGKRLIFQSTRSPYDCDQMFTMNVDGSEQKLVSTGKGRTTCGYFFPGDQKILYASTHGHADQCPPRPDKSKGYVWGVFNDYDIYASNADGSEPKVLSASPGYDAEATISPKGDKIVFTSTRDGDLELYTMNLDGSGVKRITHSLGYDGGAFFSWTGKQIVYRGYHPTDSAEVKEYTSLLAEQLVKPGKMELFICDADGKHNRQLTNNGHANFAPFFLPGDKQIIFASNMNDPRGRFFDLFVINADGSGLEQITFGGHFNAFPMLSSDGKKIVFVSDRNAKGNYEFNVFVADWVR
jgi:Tol biopolymer transport system component